MAHMQGSVFQANRTQAVRLPKAAAFPDDVKRVDVVVIGQTRILTPAGGSLDAWFDTLDALGVPEDFMTDREQPDDQDRQAF